MITRLKNTQIKISFLAIEGLLSRNNFPPKFIEKINSYLGFNAINITLGLPFIRVSPDHGPNTKMLGKNIKISYEEVRDR